MNPTRLEKKRCDDFHLDRDLSLARTPELKTKLLRALTSNDALTVHLAEAPPLDLPMVQVLCAAHRTAHRLNKRLQLALPLPAKDVLALQQMGLAGEPGCTAGAGGCLWGSPLGRPEPAGKTTDQSFNRKEKKGL